MHIWFPLTGGTEGAGHPFKVPARFQLRLLLLIAVIVLFVDAFFYSGAYTQGAYAQVKLAADQLVSLIGDAVSFGPNQESAIQPTRI